MREKKAREVIQKKRKRGERKRERSYEMEGKVTDGMEEKKGENGAAVEV